MQCDDFERFYESENLAERADFRSHLETCPACRIRAEEFARIDGAARSLKVPVAAPGLRERIEEGFAVRSRLLWRRPSRLLRVATAAAAVLLALATFSLYVIDGGTPRPAVMGRVEACSLETEIRRMELKIAGIEPRFRQEALSDAGNAPLVTGQIDYIDSNIENCRRLAAHNVLNRGVRRSLLTCYRKKIEIIDDFLSEN